MNDTPSPEPKISTGTSIVQRIHGQLHSVRTVLDEQGQVIQRSITPLMTEVRLQDICQILVGACVLGTPVAFTEEVWVLGETLPLTNILGVSALSLVFVAAFVYFVFYKDHVRGNGFEFLLRVAAVYGITLLVSATILTLFGKCPWIVDPMTAFKRTVLVGFPACFSATAVDAIK